VDPSTSSSNSLQYAATQAARRLLRAFYINENAANPEGVNLNTLLTPQQRQHWPPEWDTNEPGSIPFYMDELDDQNEINPIDPLSPEDSHSYGVHD
jgi:hypothetical protein